MKRFFRITHEVTGILLRLLTLVMTAIYLLAAFSPYIPPYHSPVPAILGLFFPVVFAGQFLFFLLWCFRRRWREVLFLLFIFIISSGSILSYLSINRTTTTESLPTGTIKVLSYNVCAFNFQKHTKEHPNPTLLYIRNSNADIVCLQEAAMGSDPKEWVTRAQLKEYLKDIYPHIITRRVQPGGSSLVLLSKFPVLKAGRLQLESNANGAVAYKLEVHGKPLLLVNVHLESFRLHRSDSETYMELLKAGNAMGIQTALDTKMGPIFKAHNEQANFIHEFIKREDTGQVIVCGDFNDTAISYAHAKIGQGLRDAFIQSGNGFGFSFNSGMFVVRIDHILSSPNWKAKGCFVDNSVNYSDHYPIQTYLIPQGENQSE